MKGGRVYIDEASSREKILGRIREALMNKGDSPDESTANIHNPPSDDRAVVFATAFTQAGGHFVYCSDTHEFLQLFQKVCRETFDTVPQVKDNYLTALLSNASIPFTRENAGGAGLVLSRCEALIANTGGIVLSEEQLSDSCGKTHGIMATLSSLYDDLTAAMETLNQKDLPGIITFVNVFYNPANNQESRQSMNGFYVFLIDTPFSDGNE